MSHVELIDAVAKKTGEDFEEIRHRGFSMDEPSAGRPDHDPDCLFDLVDLPEAGTVDWDEVLYGCREPFFTSTLKARKKKRAKASMTAGLLKPRRAAARAA